MDLLLQGVVLQVDVLKVWQELYGLDLDISDEVLTGNKFDDGGDLCEHRRKLDEGVGGNVDCLQGSAG